MNKINLIIDSLEQADRMRRKQGYTEEYLQEALAAAREIKALKPVAWVDWSMDGSQYSDTETSYGTPLYSLDEVKHD